MTPWKFSEPLSFCARVNSSICSIISNKTGGLLLPPHRPLHVFSASGERRGSLGSGHPGRGRGCLQLVLGVHSDLVTHLLSSRNPDASTPSQAHSFSLGSTIIPPHHPPHPSLNGHTLPPTSRFVRTPCRQNNSTHFTPTEARRPSIGHFLLTPEHISDTPLGTTGHFTMMFLSTY